MHDLLLVSVKNDLVDGLPQEWFTESVHDVVLVSLVHHFDEIILLEHFDARLEILLRILFPHLAHD